MNWFLALKYLHVMLAITAVGANITYAIWGARARQEPEHMRFALRGIHFLDQRVANPAYGGLLVTGLIMAAMHYSFQTRFVIIGIVLWIVMAGVGAAGYTRTVGQQIEALDEGGTESELFRRLDSRARALGIGLAILALVIVFDMVVRPGL